MKFLISFVFLICSTIHLNPLEAQSILSNFRIEDSNKKRVYFDASSDITGLSIQGVVISGKSVESVDIERAYFEVNEPFTYFDNNTIRIEEGNGIVNDFPLQYILNNIDEPKSSLIRYVSVDGTGDGTSEKDSWSLAHAFKYASAGMLIYVKSGDYGNGNFKLLKGGTAKDPIKFIGYEVSPGDNPFLSVDPNTSFSSKSMPYLKKSYADSYGDNGIDFNGYDYIIFRNFQIEGYYYGIDASESNNTTVQNCYVRDSYIGINFWKSTGGVTNGRVLNSYSSNARQDGILLNGKYGLIDSCYVSSNRSIGMDYYIGIIGSLKGDGSHVIRNCEVVRFKSDSHTGHGIDLKAQREGTKIEYCLVEDCKVSNVRQSISLRHHSVRYNVVRGAKVYGDRNGDSNLITFRDDSSYNLVENCLADNINVAIKFNMSIEEDLGRQGGGHYNRIINSVFNNCKYIIDVKGIDGKVPLKSTYNEIVNCTFYGGDYLYNGMNDYDSTNSIKNCIIMDIPKNALKGNFNPTFSNNNFYHSISPIGDNNMSYDPKFEDSSNGNFKLKSTSPMIDKGAQVEDIKLDFDGNLRPQGDGIDIGAFEYQNMLTSLIEANAGPDKNICLGESIILTASGGSSYSWSNGATTKSITVNPIETTAYIATVSKGFSSDTDEAVVTVNNVIANAGSDETINEGESITLTASGGGSYLWNNGETRASITVSPSMTTTYSVAVSKNGCEVTDEVKVEVIISSSPIVVTANAGEDQTICNGESVTLTASEGSSYSWSNGATTKSITVNPTETTGYIATVSEGSSSDTDEVVVTVINVIANAGSDETINEGESITLTASGGDSYLWSNGEITANIIVSPSTTTAYTVAVEKNGCEDVDKVLVTVNSQVPDPFQIVEGASDNQSFEEEPKPLEIQAYPNPTTGILKLESNNSYPELDIHLINSTGQILYQDKINSEKTRFSKELDLSSYTKGIYFVRLINSTQNEIKKVVLI